MNVFVLDLNTTLAAQAHVDSHCSKLILETAQLISTALRVKGIDYGYKISHQNHPCAVWARKSSANFEWLRSLGLALGVEFNYRYGRLHKSADVILKAPKLPIEDLGLTPFHQAVTDECKLGDVVQSYRAYYRNDKYKAGLIRYTNRKPPEWLSMAFEVKLVKEAVVYTANGYSTTAGNIYNWRK
jgi:hypothetical protein